MKKVPYYPGCTLINKAKGLNETAISCARAIGFEFFQLNKWYCCQASFSQVSDNIMNHLSSVRTLAAASREGDELVTLCSTCYYALKRTNQLMEKDPEKRKVAYDFIEEECKDSARVIHFLEFIREKIGFEQLKEKVKVNLNKLNAAPYYGCQLLRPKDEISFDDLYSPTIFENFLASLGCKVIDYPFKTECCGSFLTTFSQEAVLDCTYRILKYAIEAGAETIVTSCPLCLFNLDWNQKELAKKYEEFQSIPITYLTEIMALALDLKVTINIWKEHIVDPRPVLRNKGYLT